MSKSKTLIDIARKLSMIKGGQRVSQLSPLENKLHAMAQIELEMLLANTKIPLDKMEALGAKSWENYRKSRGKVFADSDFMRSKSMSELRNRKIRSDPRIVFHGTPQQGGRSGVLDPEDMTKFASTNDFSWFGSAGTHFTPRLATAKRYSIPNIFTGPDGRIFAYRWQPRNTLQLPKRGAGYDEDQMRGVKDLWNKLNLDKMPVATFNRLSNSGFQMPRSASSKKDLAMDYFTAGPSFPTHGLMSGKSIFERGFGKHTSKEISAFDKELYKNWFNIVRKKLMDRGYDSVRNDIGSELLALKKHVAKPRGYLDDGPSFSRY